MALWTQPEWMRELAEKVIASRDEVRHVDIDEVLFLVEHETKPKSAIAKCYKFGTDPINFFTDAEYAIVFYWQWCDLLSEEQLAILMLHELMHIPISSHLPLVKHTVQDFKEILEIDLDWSRPGQEVPNILK